MTPKTLDLRHASGSERLARINEAVAVYCAGWTYKPMFKDDPSSTQIWHLPDDSWSTDDTGEFCGPKFSTSADAVFPLLEKAGEIVIGKEHGPHPYNVQLWAKDYAIARAETFPLAACFALLKAAGVEILT